MGKLTISSDRLREITQFCLVGFANYLVDIAVFNAFLFTILTSYPLVAKIIATTCATLFSWVANRLWTFQQRRTASLMRELFGFIIVNILGMLPALICLGISHYLLGLTSHLADNISANVFGLVIGTIMRYVCYRRFVFIGHSSDNSSTA